MNDTPEQMPPEEITDAANQNVAQQAAEDAAERVASLEAEVASLKDKLLRALAETENVRRRAERDREETAKFAIRKFAGDLLSVADNLKRAVDAVPAEAIEKDDFLKNLVVGVEATERELSAAFDRAGVRLIEAHDKPFDPHLHEVMLELPTPDKPAGTIVQVFQTGYTLNDRLLRPARVAVAKNDDASKRPERIVDTQA